jgi:hypothetical protein
MCGVIDSTRRRFLGTAIAAGVSAFLPPGALAGTKAVLHISNGSFSFLPLGAVKPTGWLRRQLEIQAAGLSGHLDETWPDVGPNSGWLGGAGESWERGPYYLDGLVPLAYLLDDKRLKDKAQPWIEWTLKSQSPNGDFGPVAKGIDPWPRMVMLKVLTQYQEVTGDSRVIPFLQRYFAYQASSLSITPLKGWAKYRWQDNVLSVLWLYDRTNDPKLLDLARLLQSQGWNWRQEFANFPFTKKMTKGELVADKKDDEGYHQTHGVDVAMGLKSSAVWSRISNDPADRDAAMKMLSILDEYHGLPNGMYSADEHLAGRNPSQGTELCTVVEMMFSLEQAIAISGDARLADRLEKIAYNALPGAISDDMWSHQYDQQPNQIESSVKPRPWSNNGPWANVFGLDPNFGCCAANFHQGWPKLTSSLWMRHADGGLTAVVYAPSVVKTQIANTPVSIETVTEYPFRRVIEMHVKPESPVAFALHFRLPAGENVSLKVNGTAVDGSGQKGFATVTRSWSAGDVVRLEFAMAPRMIQGFENSVSVMRGPLVFSLPVEEKWNKLRDRGLTADWEILGNSSWNFGLLEATTLHVAEQPVGAIPFGKKSPPVTITAEAALLPEWKMQENVAGDFPAERRVEASTRKSVTLVPYASTKLRITAFPLVEDAKHESG